jgi:hypothetical protein
VSAFGMKKRTSQFDQTVAANDPTETCEAQNFRSANSPLDAIPLVANF